MTKTKIPINPQSSIMRITKTLFLAVLLLSSMAAISQIKNPYKSIGKKSETLTLSNGKYEEFFDEDSIQQIGTALVNVRTQKVVKLLSEEEAKDRLENEKGSRFLSVDPISSAFPELTPYQYASNNPVMNIDLDGLEGMAGNMASPGKWHIPGDANDDGHLTKEELKQGGTIMTVTALLPVEVFVTKGWITRTLTASQVLGAVEHNRAKTPEGRAAQDQRRNEALADAFITWGMGKMIGVSFNMTSELMGVMKNRLSYVRGFKGFREDYAAYVDLREKVFTRTYGKGSVLYQYQTKDGRLGNFFVESTSTTPEQVGLMSEDYTRLFKIELKEKVEVLVSKHEKGVEYWRDFDKAVKRKTAGGGEQLFTTEINSTNANITEITKPK